MLERPTYVNIITQRCKNHNFLASNCQRNRFLELRTTSTQYAYF